MVSLPSHRGTLSNLVNGTPVTTPPLCLNPLLIGEHFPTEITVPLKPTATTSQSPSHRGTLSNPRPNQPFRISILHPLFPAPPKKTFFFRFMLSPSCRPNPGKPLNAKAVSNFRLLCHRNGAISQSHQ